MEKVTHQFDDLHVLRVTGFWLNLDGLRGRFYNRSHRFSVTIQYLICLVLTSKIVEGFAKVCSVLYRRTSMATFEEALIRDPKSIASHHQLLNGGEEGLETNFFFLMCKTVPLRTTKTKVFQTLMKQNYMNVSNWKISIWLGNAKWAYSWQNYYVWE